MYKATRFMYAHKDHAYFHKVIVTVSCFNGKHLPLVYVQYFFEGAEHEHTSNQLFHGNNLKKSDRSSRPEMFCRKGGLKNFTKFTGKHPCRSLLFNKIADLSLFFLHNTSGDCFYNDMPNSLRQVYDISLKSILNQDELVEVLDICQK